ncbi:ABC transporter ATP-binding protein [Falsiroseomonas sp.]|uniref:ABC transporter ATP-binding protein n=1 Tax=Falsiroseomonas sp. TaxID=2870721 RepID=UPI003568E859
MTAPLLSVEDLSLSIRTPEGEARVLDRVSLDLQPGALLGLVGESGCGKSTLVKTVLGVLPPAARATGGRILLDGRDLLRLPQAVLAREVRGRRLGFIPQDPALALNPMFTVGTQLLEIWRWHAPEGEDRGRAAGRARILSLFRRVQIPDAEAALDRHPHQFSGGQRQRVLIAAALLCRPALLVADEPTTALDVTTQQQILSLLGELAAEYGLSVLFVTHDFGVVSAICTHVAVMYAGQMVEAGTKADVLGAPCHPYTAALLACHPDRMAELAGIPGAVPSPLTPPAGCRFHPRCDVAEAGCQARPAGLTPQPDGRGVGCIRFDPARPAA